MNLNYEMPAWAEEKLPPVSEEKRYYSVPYDIGADGVWLSDSYLVVTQKKIYLLSEGSPAQCFALADCEEAAAEDATEAAVLEAVPPQAVRAAAAPAMPAAARKLRREMRWSFISVFLLQVKNILFLRPAKENRAGKPYLRAHSPSRPAAMRTPCSRLGRMYSRFSCTALGLPGRLTMSVLPRSTLTPRLSIPRGVMLRL